MTKATRKQYTLEFKQEAVRLVESGQSLASAARTLGIIEQTLGNWVKAQRKGTLQGASGKASVTAEQMENRRLRAELARVTMERDILGKELGDSLLAFVNEIRRVAMDIMAGKPDSYDSEHMKLLQLKNAVKLAARKELNIKKKSWFCFWAN